MLRSAGMRCEVIAPSLIPTAPGQRGRNRQTRCPPAGAAVPGRSAHRRCGCQPRRRRRCGICAGPAPTWSSTAPEPGTGSASSCCATAGCGVAGTTGRSNKRPGSAQQRFDERALNDDVRALSGHADRARSSRRRHRGRPACRGVSGRRSPILSPGWAPTGVSPSSARSPWRRRCATGAGSRPPSMFMGFCRARALGAPPAASAPNRGGITHAGNAHLRTQLVEAAWAYKSRAQVGRHPRQAPRRVSTPPSSLAPGLPSCVCAASSIASMPAKPAATSSSPPSPANSPGSCGPR